MPEASVSTSCSDMPGLVSLNANDEGVSSSEPEKPGYAHVIVDEEDLDQLFQVDLPTEEYYGQFELWLAEKFPNSSPFVREHALALEPMLDTAIVSGFSFGVKKAELYRVEVQYLGEIVGRETRRPKEDHIKAIANFPEPIPDLPALRRFMGVVNWVRPHAPAEFASAAKGVTKYLSKTASWSKEPPYMGKDGCDGVKALKALVVRTINLNALDELAALDGSRPLEQIADWNPVGWGGAAFQMSPDGSRLLVLGQWSGACTPAQQAYPSTTGELFAQREVSRERRKALGLSLIHI